MYNYIEGSIFESPAQTLVNTVNLAGAMGKGLAKEFRRLFPDMFHKYQDLCESGKFQMGKLWIYYTPNKWILNFPTKKHWRYPSKNEYVELGLKAFVAQYNRARITSAAFPKLGCGNGELDWRVVKPLMEKYLRPLPIDIYVYEINTSVSPEHKNIEEMRKWLMSEPLSYPFSEFKQDIIELIKNPSALIDRGDNSFKAKYTATSLIIEQSNREFPIPWLIEESGNGLRELWQYFRTKGVLTLNDITNMGFLSPECIMGLLLKLPYVGFLKIRNKTTLPAIYLKPINQEKPLPLFCQNSDRSISLQM